MASRKCINIYFPEYFGDQKVDINLYNKMFVSFQRFRR